MCQINSYRRLLFIPLVAWWWSVCQHTLSGEGSNVSLRAKAIWRQWPMRGVCSVGSGRQESEKNRQRRTYHVILVGNVLMVSSKLWWNRHLIKVA